MTWAQAVPSWSRAWEQCPRGDWVIALAARAGVDNAMVISAACACAREVLGQLDAERARAEVVIAATEQWLAAPGGEPSSATAARAARITECERAAAAAADPATAAALHAAAMAGRAVLDGAHAAGAAAAAVEAITFSAGDCAMLEALRFAQRKTADLARAKIPLDALLAALSGAG